MISDLGNKDSDPYTRDEGWRHGDIKPDNILVFLRSGTRDEIHTLKLGDFGAAKYMHSATTLRHTTKREEWRTVAYEPPDYYLQHGPIPRLSDVWSFGCVIYEFVLWLLYGVQGVEKFYLAARKQQHSSPYWMRIDSPRGALVSAHFQVRTRYILENDPECTTRPESLIRSLIELVRDKCLIVDLPDSSERLCNAQLHLIFGMSSRSSFIRPKWMKAIALLVRIEQLSNLRFKLSMKSSVTPLLDLSASKLKTNTREGLRRTSQFMHETTLA